MLGHVVFIFYACIWVMNLSNPLYCYKYVLQLFFLNNMFCCKVEKNLCGKIFFCLPYYLIGFLSFVTIVVCHFVKFRVTTVAYFLLIFCFVCRSVWSVALWVSWISTVLKYLVSIALNSSASTTVMRNCNSCSLNWHWNLNKKNIKGRASR